MGIKYLLSYILVCQELTTSSFCENQEHSQSSQLLLKDLVSSMQPKLKQFFSSPLLETQSISKTLAVLLIF